MRMTHRITVALAICLGLVLSATSVLAADAEATPQAKAYRAALKAIAAGDYDAYRKTLSTATAKRMDDETKGKSHKEVMEFLKMISPTDVKLTGVKVDGLNATLSADAKMDGQPVKGSIALQEEGGQWKAGQPSWQPMK